ncbi:NADPH-dependent F420 reductase [Promicromonospora sp. NFX87]|uniref:NADPH-dependent F420 reductase n=1 Tax=Promicromonospora sp. NFX87 TaxID=3402691 RepID=UPI003AFAC2B6
MNSASRPVIGVFGAGKSGVAIARLALDAGYTVRIASSGTAEDTDQLLRFVAPGAVATTAHDLPAEADVLVIAVPLRRFRELPLDALAGHVVVDVMNYWPPIDGALPEFEAADQPSSTIVRDALPETARLVKTFNHLGYHQMEELPRPAGAPDRTAIGIAGDDTAAVETVAHIVNALGFEPVLTGSFAASAHLEPDGPVFGKQLDAAAMRQVLELSRSDRAA